MASPPGRAPHLLPAGRSRLPGPVGPSGKGPPSVATTSSTPALAGTGRSRSDASQARAWASARASGASYGPEYLVMATTVPVAEDVRSENLAAEHIECRTARRSPQVGPSDTECDEHGSQQRKRESDDVVVVAFDAADEGPAEPVDGEGAGYLKRLSGGDVCSDFVVGQ